jgi:hypothetical protein
MTPTEIAHAVEDALGRRVDPIQFAALAFHVSPGEIRMLQRGGQLPDDLDMAGVLELLHRPEMAEWRRVRDVVSQYQQFGSEPIADLTAAVDAHVELRKRFPRDPEDTFFDQELRVDDVLGGALWDGLERVAGVVSA